MTLSVAGSIIQVEILQCELLLLLAILLVSSSITSGLLWLHFDLSDSGTDVLILLILVCLQIHFFLSVRFACFIIKTEYNNYKVNIRC